MKKNSPAALQRPASFHYNVRIRSRDDDYWPKNTRCAGVLVSVVRVPETEVPLAVEPNDVATDCCALTRLSAAWMLFGYCASSEAGL